MISDMDILRLAAVTVVFLIICLLIKQIRPEFSPFLQIAAVICLTTIFADSVKKLLNELDAIIGADTFVEDGYIVLLVRMLGIAVITKIASDICKDNSNNTLSTCVELFGKVLIFSMCLPLIKVIAELARGLLV